jgi:hypothetical protein
VSVETEFQQQGEANGFCVAVMNLGAVWKQ